MNNITFQSFPTRVQVEVQQMNDIFDTPEKRKYAADKARLFLSQKTESNVYSKAYAYLLNAEHVNDRVQEEYTQKLVTFYRHAQNVRFNDKSLLADFINNNGKLPHSFTSYR